MTKLPLIAITMGDPLGVGREIIAKAFSGKKLFLACRPLVVGSAGVLKKAAAIVGSELDFRTVDGPSKVIGKPGVLDVLEPAGAFPDRPDPERAVVEAGRASAGYVLRAIDMAMEGKVHGMATAPISKASINAAGYAFDGHTEILAQKTRTKDYVMMMAGDKLRVSLVTIHQSLASVPAALCPEKILTTIRITHAALKERFGFERPRIAVAGLNPHAGEQGMFGDEETRLILPAMEKARASGMELDGPYPPDTLFFRAVSGPWHAVISMYHDQGLIPFKMVHFEDGVNTTLGLPIIRTSVDHGTAFDIAGTGKADPGSLTAAVSMAAEQAANRFGPFPF